MKKFFLSLTGIALLLSPAIILGQGHNLSNSRVAAVDNPIDLITLNDVEAQLETVSGQVTDSETQELLPGVNISIQGTNSGTVTNLEGEYELTVPSLQDTLVFSYIGYEPRLVPINGRTTINISMDPQTIAGDEVVVVAYGQQSRAEVTGSVSSVTAEDILRAPTSNLGNALVGKVTGLSAIQRSGQPGADEPNIFIRGFGSLTEGRSSPLIIVDGVERRSFAQLDPNNVESISVLKDASATAVYGVRGANGVIVIQTKRGRTGPIKISLNLSSGFQQPTTLLEFADSYTYAQRMNEAQLNDGIDPSLVRFSDEALEAFRTNSDPIIYPNTDWVDYIMKPLAFQSNNNVNISGGTENVRFFIAAGYLRQDGLFRTFDDGYNNNFTFDRYNFRTNLDVDVTPSTVVSLTSAGRIEQRNSPQVRNSDGLWRQIYWSVPFSGPGIVDDKWVRNGNFYITDEKKDGLQSFYGTGLTNSSRNVLNLDLGVKQNLDFITDGLLFQLKGAYNTYYTQTKSRSTSTAEYEPFYKVDVDPTAVGDSTIVYKKSGDEGILGYNESYGRDRDWYLEARVSYKGSFGSHSFGGLLLYNQRKNYYPATFVSIPRGLVGTVGRLNYNYDRRYLFEASMGYNGSENFAEGRRFGFFPAVSAGWVLTNEKFMQDIEFLDHLKFRASYGIVGNDLGVGRFLYLPGTYFASAGGYNFGVDVPQNQTGAREGQIGNPLVTWESSTKQNYGINLRILDDRLDLSADIFHEYREDILTTRNTVPSFVAATLPAVNIGEVENRGYEIELKWREQRGNFFYNIDTNFSFSRNEIIYMDEVPRSEDYLFRTGNSVGQRFGYVFDRFWTESDLTDESIPDHQYQAKPGDLMYKDLNGDNVIDTDDQRAIGFPEFPEYTFGVNMGFRYKNVDFAMVWAGATNTSRLLGGEPYRIAFGSTGNRSLMQWHADERWTPETAETATYPRLTFAGRTNNMKTSDFWMRDASYIRLKNIKLGYNFPQSFLQKFGLRNLRAYVNGYNLLTFSKMDIADPESRTASNSDYPIVKVYNLGIQIDF